MPLVLKFRKKVSLANVESANEYLQLHGLSISPHTPELQPSRIEEFYARDILRAAKLPTLSTTQVARQLLAISSADRINPVILVLTNNGLIVADGYHRLCAARLLSERARVKAALVDLRK